MSIEAWMPALKSTLGGIAGIEQVHSYDDLPAIIQVFPTIIIIPMQGYISPSAGGLNISLHSVQARLYATAQVLPEAYGVAVPYIGMVARKIAENMQLGGIVQHIAFDPARPSYEIPLDGIEYGVDPYGAPRRHPGVIFNLEIKEHETYTVSA